MKKTKYRWEDVGLYKCQVFFGTGTLASMIKLRTSTLGLGKKRRGREHYQYLFDEHIQWVDLGKAKLTRQEAQEKVLRLFIRSRAKQAKLVRERLQRLEHELGAAGELLAKPGVAQE